MLIRTFLIVGCRGDLVESLVETRKVGIGHASGNCRIKEVAGDGAQRHFSIERTQMSWRVIPYRSSAPPEERHFGLHDRQELDVCLQRQACHVEDRFGDVL